MSSAIVDKVDNTPAKKANKGILLKLIMVCLSCDLSILPEDSNDIVSSSRELAHY